MSRFTNPPPPHSPPTPPPEWRENQLPPWATPPPPRCPVWGTDHVWPTSHHLICAPFTYHNPRGQATGLPQGSIRKGGREGGGGGVEGWVGSDPPPPMVPLWSPPKGRPKNFKLKSSWRQRRQSKIFTVSLKRWKGRRGARG